MNENPPINELSNPDRNSIDAYGFTVDYLNELPSRDFEENPAVFAMYMEYYKSGEAKTYSEKYKDRPEIIEASDPQIVAKIDSIMLQIIEAAKRDNEEKVKELIKTATFKLDCVIVFQYEYFTNLII